MNEKIKVWLSILSVIVIMSVLTSFANADIFINESFESGSIPTNWSVFDGSQNFAYTPPIEGTYSVAGTGNGFLRFPNWSMDYNFLYGMKNYSVLFNITDDQAGPLDLFYFTTKCRGGFSGGPTNHHIHYAFNDGSSETTGTYDIPLNEVFKLNVEFDGYGIDIALINVTTGAVIETLGEVGCDDITNYNLVFLMETKDYYLFDNFVVQNITVPIIPDTDSPEVNLSANATSIYHYDSISLNASISDLSGQLKICYLTDNVTVDVIDSRLISGYNAECLFNITYNETATTKKKYFVYANDSSDNVGSDSIVITINYYVPGNETPFNFSLDDIGQYNWSIRVSKTPFTSCNGGMTDILLRMFFVALGLTICMMGMMIRKAKPIGFIGVLILITAGLIFTPCQALIGILVVIMALIIGGILMFI